MFIEKIIIEGFKSYAHREVIGDFDPNFTAITGLNGSGKSNVFDAIIFVLGVTNWSQLRVQNPQNLVYKSGQAGIHKASVTIIFNNADKDASPVGYEKAAQITVTRQVIIRGHDTVSKFLINGLQSTLKKVKQLFRSVQLNVKNPHFLIMQGRITKVLNMKPAEVLGMIEEAAGTKMYDEKREEALREIDRKQRKVDEIHRILRDEINPTLASLDKQQRQYIQYQEAKRDFERLDKFRIAHHYVSAANTLSAAQEDLRKIDEDIQKFQRQKAEHHALIRSIEAEIEELQARKAEALTDDYKAFLAEVGDLDKAVAKQEASRTTKEAAKQEAEAALEGAKKAIEKLEQSLVEGRQALEAVGEALKAAETERDKKKEFLESLQLQRQAIAAGVAADQGKNLADLLMQLDADEKAAASEITLASKRTAANKKELTALQASLKKNDATFSALKAEEQALLQDAAELKRRLDAVPFSEVAFAAAQEKRQQLAPRMKELKGLLDKLRAELHPRRAFNYAQPDAAFDGRQVRGRLMDLFELKDGRYAQALDVTAGGRLFDVVVDNEHVSKALLERGKLKSRTTFIPLSKIQSQELTREQIAAAQRLVGKDQVWPALTLLQFAAEYEPAMRYVFGRTFICASSDAAKKVCFHDGVKARCVTLDGDLFEPHGTLTGGSAPPAGALVAKLHDLRQLERDVETRHKDLRTMEDEIVRLDSLQREHAKLHGEVALKAKNLELLQARLAQTDGFQKQQDVARLQGALQADEQAAHDWAVKKDSALTRAREVKEQIKSFNKEDQMKKTDRDIEAARKDLKKQEEQLAKQRAKQNEALALIKGDDEALKEERQRAQELQGAIGKMSKELQDEEKKLGKLRKEYEEKSEVVKSRKAEAQAADNKIAKLVAQKEAADADLEGGKLKMKEWEHRQGTLREAQEKAKRLKQQMLGQYPWIDKEEQFFGKAHGEFDFSARKIEEVNKRLAQLEEEQDRLGKQINTKALAMFEQAQTEHKDLIGKKETIDSDRKKIELFIQSLDEKKLTAIQDTYEAVNGEFGKIFGSLLPATNAKLEPDDGHDIMRGLKVVVALGGVWKETLSELSGGQKSLLALALVLAMLVYKPAPMYILDEIDAALDLSHTQNIGEVLKHHEKFRKAQFIIISLKEGMFNNANVLFRVQNLNGSSKVSRIDNTSRKGKGKRASDADEQEHAEGPPVEKLQLAKRSRKEQPV